MYMLFAAGKRLLYVCLVVVMLMVLHMCHTCQVGAIRVFPGNAVANVELTHGNIMDNNRSKEDLFKKYLDGRTYLGPVNTTQKGFDDSKRRVPSCPDPLHN